MEEIWKFIEGYDEAYRVSNLGRVQTCKRPQHGKTSNWRDLKPDISTWGYKYVYLCKNSKPKHHIIHRVVASAFILNPLNKKIVNHIDGNKLNNQVDNLEWVSHRENDTHGKINSKKASKYIGVYLSKNKKRWRSSIYVKGKSIKLGTFDTELEVRQAYLTALEKHRIVNKYATIICNTSHT